MWNLIWFLLIGVTAGWLAGKATRGRGYGLFGNMTLGTIGAVLGGFLFGFLGIPIGGPIGALLMSFAGALLVLFLVRLAKKA